jgi:hypothetical protein
MARMKLDIPSRIQFTTELNVRISDVNYGGHLGNDAVLSLIHEARVQFLNHFGYSEKDIEETGIIMADSVVIYRSEAFTGTFFRSIFQWATFRMQAAISIIEFPTEKQEKKWRGQRRALFFSIMRGKRV